MVTAVGYGEVVITATTNEGGFSDSANIDIVSREEANALLSEALNGEGMDLMFDNDVAHPWSPVMEGDRFAAVSTNHGISSSSAITLEAENLNRGSTITWDWKTSAESYFDTLRFSVNGTSTYYLRGEVDWSTISYTIPYSGDYVFTWTFAKDGSGDQGLDCAWVDNVLLERSTPASVAGVELLPETVLMLANTSFQLNTNVLPFNATNANVTFSSSNEAVAIVSDTGLVTSITNGEATITVTTEEGGFTDVSTVKVIDLPAPIPHTELSYDRAIKLGNADSFYIGLGLDSTHIYKPDITGNVTTTSTTFGIGFYIDLAQNEIIEFETLGEVDTCMWVFNENMGMLGYSDNDAPNGLLSYIKFAPPEAGRYYVLVTGFNETFAGYGGLIATHYEPVLVDGVTITPKSITLGIDRYSAFLATISPENADFKSVTWSIEDESIATIDIYTGRVYGVSEGTTTVTVTTDNGGFTDTAEVTVIPVENPDYDGMLYAYNMYSADGIPEGFVRMDPMVGGGLIQPVTPGTLMMYSGEYYNGLVYGYGMQMFFVFEIPCYYVIDTSTWSMQFTNFNLPSICYDMTYDYSTNTMYGLSDDANGVRNLCTVDLPTGAITFLGQIDIKLGEAPMNLSSDNTGNLYITSTSGTFYRVDKNTLEAVDLNNIGYTLAYVQGMGYDRILGKMYMVQLNDNGSHFIEVDRTTGAVINETPVGVGVNEFTSLFFFVNPEDVVPESTEPIPAENMTITPEQATIEVGETTQFRPVFTPINATERDVIWKSSSDNIATVDDRGIVTAVAPGSAYITATTVVGGFSAHALVNVPVPVSSNVPQGYAMVTLTVPDVWGDGTGYQLLMDADATAYGTVFPVEGPLSQGGDVNPSVYAQFEYKIPEDADGSLNTQNVVFNNTVSILVPEGTYDICVTNPTPGGRMWIANNGRGDDVEIFAGYEYTFTMSLSGENDLCTWSNEFVGFIDENPAPHYTVTFVDYDDSVIATSIVVEGSPALAPNDPVRDGYEFIGWDVEFSNVIADMTVTALYEVVANPTPTPTNEPTPTPSDEPTPTPSDEPTPTPSDEPTPTPVWGDANGDGETNTGDAAMILRYVARLDTLTDEQLIAADANGDGDVNAGDASTILIYVAFGEI